MANSLMKKKVSEKDFKSAQETVKNSLAYQEQSLFDYAVDTVLMLWQEQEKNRPQQKMVFSRSLNPSSTEIRYIELKHAWKESERRRKANAHKFNLIYTELSFERFLLYNNIDLENYLKKPVSRLDYYFRNSKYNNNVKVKGNSIQVR